MRSRSAPPASWRSSISPAGACSSPSRAPASRSSPRPKRWTRPMPRFLVKAALLIALGLSAPAFGQTAQIPVEEAPATAPASAPATPAAPGAATPTGPVTPATPGQPGALDRALHTISGNGQPMALSLQILLLMSLLTVLPSILL